LVLRLILRLILKDDYAMRSLALVGIALACVTLPPQKLLAQTAPAQTSGQSSAPISAPISAMTPAQQARIADKMAAQDLAEAPVLAPGGTPDGNGLPATLSQALVEAYNNNATLQEQRAALRQADEDVPTALSGWMPTVALSGSYGRTSETQTLQGLNNLGVLADAKTPENFNQSTAQATATEQVYSGGKTTAEIRQAKNSVYAARAQLLSTEQTVFLNVAQAFVSVVTDTQVLALDVNNQAVLRQQLQDTTTQFNVGEITMTSVAQAQASYAQAIEQVQVASGNLKIAQENFRQLVGDYPAGTLVPPQPLEMPLNSKAAVATASLSNNPNVIAAEFTDAANKDGINVAFAALMPQLQIQASAFHEVGQDLQNSQLKGGSIIGQLNIPLYQGGEEYAAIRAAKAKQQQSFASIIDAQRTAWYQGSQAWVAVTATRAAIIATNAEIKANAIALDGTEREELVGTRTTLDVLNAQQLLLNSQVQQVQNIGTLVNNTYAVTSAIGRLTVKDLGLPVQEYDDLKYYDAVKDGGFGTGEIADREAGISSDGTLLHAAQPIGGAAPGTPALGTPVSETAPGTVSASAP
jgi:outer membrane protein